MVNLYKRFRSKLEIQEEMKQYENIKSIKVRHDRYGYKINEAIVCYSTQKRQKYSVKLHAEIKWTEWHAEIYQNRYAELNEGRNKNIKENINCGESKRNETNNERQNHQSRKEQINDKKKEINKCQEEMNILKSDISQIKEYIKTIWIIKND